MMVMMATMATIKREGVGREEGMEVGEGEQDEYEDKQEEEEGKKERGGEKKGKVACRRSENFPGCCTTTPCSGDCGRPWKPSP